MISKISGSWIVAAVLCGTGLAGCDSIKDVRTEPATDLPPRNVMVNGTISGLGSRRSLVLTNNGDLQNAQSFLAPIPTVNSEQLEGITPFSFGAHAEGQPYNVQISQQPFGKSCAITGGAGTLDADNPPDIQVVCTNNTPRYSMTVALNPSFASAQGARVTLTTEESVYRQDVTAGMTSVTFTDVLFNPTLNNPQASIAPTFDWSVTASTTVGGGLNKCPVTNPSNPVVAGVVQNPTGNISTPSVGVCSFTIGGRVDYSLPAAGGAAPANPGGLLLELRNIKEEVVATHAYSAAFGNTFTFSDAGTPIQWVSNPAAVYHLTVAAHPTGYRCVAGAGTTGASTTAILYAPTLTSNPANITNLQVYCRAIPATAAQQLNGTYRLTTSVWTPSVGATSVTSTWAPGDTTRQNTASSNMLTFFEDGTFLYGTHANTTQVEHGFYEYNPGAQTLRFSLHADTNTSTLFPRNFSATATNGLTTTPGLSAAPGATGAAPLRQATLTGVQFSDGPPATLTGTFSGLAPGATAPADLPAARLDWVLQEPPQITNEMEGTWVSQDHRRSWVFDSNSYYGTHIGVAGVITMNDSCFTMQDVHASSSFYTRRGSLSGCYPWNRPAANQFYFITGAEAVDFLSPSSIGTGGGSVSIAAMQEFRARLPGGQSAFDGRSPSPVYFHIAAPAAFFATADPQYFPPGAPTDWCTTELLGIRATLNGIGVHTPVYFCRTRADND